MAKRFFYVCAGLFMLALTYHLGARSAGAQGSANPVVGVSGMANGSVVAVTYNGDVYAANCSGCSDWHKVTSIFAGGPTPAQPATFGAVKAKYHN